MPMFGRPKTAEALRDLPDDISCSVTGHGHGLKIITGKLQYHRLSAADASTDVFTGSACPSTLMLMLVELTSTRPDQGWFPSADDPTHRTRNVRFKCSPPTGRLPSDQLLKRMFVVLE